MADITGQATVVFEDGRCGHTALYALKNASAGGGNTGTSGTAGKSPGTITYQSVVYTGGAAVGTDATGNPPGGAGGGAGPYQTGGDGADGQIWIVARP